MEKILRSYQGSEPYAFISYSHKDKGEVFPVIRAMQENGYNVWFDEGITPASEWDDHIANRILNAEFFIAMLSPNYLESTNCMDELEFARSKDKKRLMIYLKEATLPPGPEMRLSRQQAILKYRYPDISYFYDKLFHSDGIDICKSQSIRFYSGDAADNAFEIENGVLKKYHGDANAVVIPDGVTSIGDFAFQNCESLTAVKIADSVTSIGNFAFWGCGALASVYIPDGVTSIGDGAFQACDALTTIDLPESVMHLGRCAFNTNTRTSTPTPTSEPMNQAWIEPEHDEPAVPEPPCEPVSPITDFEIENGVLKKYLGKSETVVIPEGVVTSIGDEAFIWCRFIKSIYIPNSVTSIGDMAFAWCKALTSIVIPDSVTSIGDMAFVWCESLTSIVIPDSVTSIGGTAFAWCESLTSIVIPDSVTSIGDSAFLDCESLTSIYIPNGVTSIGKGAFNGCNALTSIHIPNSVTKIEEEAFFGCYALSSIEIPASVEKIGKHAFSSNTAIRNKSSVAIPPISDFDIEHGTLRRYLGKSNSVVIPSSVVSIGDSAFWKCKSLTSIVIPDSVTSIGDKAFSCCNTLTSIEIPNNVTSIGDDAFSNCEALTSIKIPNGVTSIGNEAFKRCGSLTSIEIPDSVTSIGDEAFLWCDSLKSVKIPKSVTHIGKDAFPPDTKIIRI